MPENYKQRPVSIAGVEHTRAHTLRIINPFGGIPSISVGQEVVIQVEGQPAESRPTAGFTVVLDNPLEEFALSQPLSSGATTATQQDMYKVLSSWVEFQRAKIDALENAGSVA